MPACGNENAGIFFFMGEHLLSAQTTRHSQVCWSLRAQATNLLGCCDELNQYNFNLELTPGRARSGQPIKLVGEVCLVYPDSKEDWVHTLRGPLSFVATQPEL